MAIFAARKKNRMYKFRNTSIFFVLLMMFSTSLMAQSFITDDGEGSLQLNTITTAVPFLMITPDARAGGMGDVGAATDPDGASIHWNPAKMAFIETKAGFSLSYTPWLKALVPDINLAYLSGYGKIGKKGDQTVSGSLRYFSLGNIQFTDNNGQAIRDFNPNELAIDASYARKLSKQFSGGIALRLVTSNLTGGLNVQGTDTRAGTAFAADVSFYYRTYKLEIADKKTIVSAGLVFSNIGSKMAYSRNNEEDFIPINMRLGLGFKIYPDEKYSVALFFDVNKLLVPTPPQLGENQFINNELPPGDSIGQIRNPSNIDPTFQQIVAGKDPNRSVPEGIFGSFGDAPGGSREELNEVNFSVGLEWDYNNVFAVRAGYFYEHPTKGNRQFLTLGASIGYKVFRLDFAYLISTTQRNPLENTLRFSLSFDFEAFKKQNKSKD